MHRTQHFGQHMVRFDLQVIRPQLDGHVPVTQVVGGPRQIKGRAVRGAGGDAQDGLWRGFDAYKRAVFGHQHIATAHHGAARQKHAHAAPERVGGFKAALLAHVPIQGQCGGAFDKHRGQALALRNQFGSLQHQNKK